MNLHGIVSPYIATINPMVVVTMQVSAGYTRPAPAAVAGFSNPKTKP
jgi:hypothetical protein